MQKLTSCFEFQLLSSPCRTAVYRGLRKRSCDETKFLRHHQWSSRTLLYLFPINFNWSPNPSTYRKDIFLSICTSSSISISNSFAPSPSLSIQSLQLHLPYPPAAPAVTLKQLSAVTMVTHTTIQDFYCHHPHYHHCHHCWCWDCETLPIFWSWPDMHNEKNSVDAVRGQAGWVSCLTEKWLADVKLSNWKEWTQSPGKEGTCVCMCLCMWVCLVCSQDFSYWLPALTDILFFALL